MAKHTPATSTEADPTRSTHETHQTPTLTTASKDPGAATSTCPATKTLPKKTRTATTKATTAQGYH